jgi:hypothetical protein
MRTKQGQGTEFATHVSVRYLFAQWLQAGFTGIAYRLAHLSVHRSLAVVSVSALFYLV